MSAAQALRPLPIVRTAQTSVELFTQLREQGAVPEVFDGVRAAHALAMRLFAGRMHPSGKPYLSHCDATASGLASVGAPLHLVVAGLLHAVYRWGDFGPYRFARPLQRRWLRHMIGTSAEASIFRFQGLPWTLDALRQLNGRANTLDAVTRDTVLIALVNDLDNWSDRAPLFCHDAERRRVSIAQRGSVHVDLARVLGFPTLAAAIERAVTEIRDAEVPATLRWVDPSACLVIPASGRRKRRAVVVAALRESVRAMRQRAGAA